MLEAWPWTCAASMAWRLQFDFRTGLCGNQPVGWVILKSIVWTFVDLHALEQMQLRGHRHVDAAGLAATAAGTSMRR